MGRIYKRKGDGNRHEEALRQALDEVKSGSLSQRKAAEKYGVPKSTLADYVGRDQVDQAGFSLRSFASRQIFSPQLEVSLSEYLKKCSEMFYGLSTKQTRALAYEYALANNLTTPEKWHQDKEAGKEWLMGFLRRNSSLSIRKPEATSLARMTSFNKENVKGFFEKLEGVLQKHSFTASSIYNVDETGCTTVQRPPKQIAPRGAHQVGSATSRERGELVTFVGICSASGNALPPCFVFPRVRFDETRMMKGTPSGSLGLVDPSGWMTKQNFPRVLEHIVSNVRCSQEKPILLIMDNHVSHLSVEAINYAKDNGIVLFTMPPHTSMRLQPLDVSVYGPFKTFLNQEMSAWMVQHPGRAATIYDVPELACKAWDRAATPTNVKSGFRATGVEPFNPNVFREEDFLMSFVTDRPEVQAAAPEAQAAASGAQAAGPEAQAAGPEAQEAPAEEGEALECRAVVFPEQVRPYPKAPPRKTSRRDQTRKGRSMVATDTPEKLAIEARDAARKAATVKKCKRKVIPSSDSSSASETGMAKTSESSEVDDSLAADAGEEDVTLSNTDPQTGDFVLVALDPSKGLRCHFVGRVDGMLTGNDISVSYMRKSSKLTGNTFVFPDVPDVASVSKMQIIGVLPPPERQSIKQRAGYLKFPVSFAGFNMR